MSQIKIVLVEDHNIIRSGLRVFLEQQPDIVIAGEAANGQDAINLARELSPDVFLMDVVLRGSEISGIQATRKITEMKKGIKVIALSVMEEQAYVKGMLSAGASGYLFKGCNEIELMEAIYSVINDETYFSKGAERVIQDAYVDMIQNPAKDRHGDLTDREVEILRLTALGENSKEIGDKLSIHRKTVDTHKRRILEKLNLRNIAELTRYALRHRIIHELE